MTPQAVSILTQLLDREDGIDLNAVSSESLSPESLEASLRELQSLGCEIDCSSSGVVMRRASLETWADYIEAHQVESLGQKVHVYRETGSTQDIAKRLVEAASSKEVANHIVLADTQSAGRGRLGRAWASKPGACVLLSCIVDYEQHDLDHLMLATCCAIGNTIEAFIGKQVQVRWPNDILINDHKVSGTLVELHHGLAVIGIGVNVFLDPEALVSDVRNIATSMHLHHAVVDRLPVILTLLQQIEQMLNTPSEALKSWWYERSILFEKRVKVECDGRQYTGRVIDLDVEKGLMIAVDQGPITVFPAASTSLVFE